jgi:hypothetical protein
LLDDKDAEAASSVLPLPLRSIASRLRLKEPELFKGKTLKEAREFIRTLELIFALSIDVYRSDHKKVLYSVIFLAGEPRET